MSGGSRSRGVAAAAGGGRPGGDKWGKWENAGKGYEVSEKG